MPETAPITRLLTQHFFRRFFDNDTLQTDGDTSTSVVRAIAITAIPGLLIAFFLQNQYPARALAGFTPDGKALPAWGSIQDQYFFVLFSFIVLAAVSIFEWEMLFPDRLDFLILSPLSLKPAQLFVGKAIALVLFFSLFLVGTNLLGTFMLPLISKLGFGRQLVAHAAAVLLAGIFASLLILALGGLLLCVLSPSAFRLVSPILRMLAIAALVLLLVHYARFGDSLEALLSMPLGKAKWLPPLWFLGVYEHLLHGAAAPPFARPMAVIAVRATAIVFLVVLATYPIAWARMRRMAVEGISRQRPAPSPLLTRLVHTLVRRPAERAVFHFIGQTIARNTQYQVYLALYLGTGLALGLACAVTLHVTAGSVTPALNQRGLHALLPLLLFWIVAGLRAAFAFPLSLSARWVFRVAGANLNECAAAAPRWTLLCALAATLSILAVLAAAAWHPRQLLIQIVCGIILSLLLTDLFFASQGNIPFNQPRLPGRTNFPLLLTLYIGILPLFVLGTVRLEAWFEATPLRLLGLALTALGIHLLLRRNNQALPQPEEELEGYEGEFQILGLS